MSREFNRSNISVLRDAADAMTDVATRVDDARAELTYLSGRLTRLIADYPALDTSAMCRVCLFGARHRFLGWMFRCAELENEMERMAAVRAAREEREWKRRLAVVVGAGGRVWGRAETERAILERAEVKVVVEMAGEDMVKVRRGLESVWLRYMTHRKAEGPEGGESAQGGVDA